MQFAQKIFKLNLNWSSFFNAGHYVAFKHRISFATDLAATFGCYRVRIMPVIFYKLLCAAISLCCSIWIWADALFRTGRRFKLLLCTGFDSEHTVLFLCNILLRDQWLIKRWIEAMGAALVGNNFSPIPSKISFRMKKKKTCRTVAARNLQGIKTFFDSWTESVSQEWSHVFLKGAGSCPQRLPQTRKSPVFMLARPTRPSCAGA